MQVQYGSGWKTANASGTYCACVTSRAAAMGHSTHHFVRALATNQIGRWIFFFFHLVFHFTLPYLLRRGSTVITWCRLTPVLQRTELLRQGGWIGASENGNPRRRFLYYLSNQELQGRCVIGISTFHSAAWIFISQKQGKESSTSLFLLHFCFLFLSFYLFLCFQLPSNVIVLSYNPLDSKKCPKSFNHFLI